MCVGTSVAGRALSSTWGLSSLHPEKKLLTFLNSASSGGFKVVEFLYALIFLFWRGRDPLDRTWRKQRSLKRKSCDNSIQKCGVRGSMFPCIAQLPDSSSSFWRAPGGWKSAVFCVSAAHGILPSVTSSFSAPYTEPQGRQELETGLPWDFSNS